MVWRAPKPNLRLASCCSVEVMNGAEGLRLAGLASTARTVRSREVIAATAISASSAVARSNFSSRLPARLTRRAVNSCPRGVASRAETVQYSRVLNASISISRSTISRSATDWTRPADLAPGSLRQSTGESLKPTR